MRSTLASAADEMSEKLDTSDSAYSSNFFVEILKLGTPHLSSCFLVEILEVGTPHPSSCFFVEILEVGTAHASLVLGTSRPNPYPSSCPPRPRPPRPRPPRPRPLLILYNGDFPGGCVRDVDPIYNRTIIISTQITEL